MRRIPIKESGEEHLARLKNEYRNIVQCNHIMSYYMFQRFAYLKREIEILENVLVE